MSFKNDDAFFKIKEFAMENSKPDDIHGFPHVKRVYDLCLIFGKKLNAQLKILQIAHQLQL